MQAKGVLTCYIATKHVRISLSCSVSYPLTSRRLLNYRSNIVVSCCGEGVPFNRRKIRGRTEVSCSKLTNTATTSGASVLRKLDISYNYLFLEGYRTFKYGAALLRRSNMISTFRVF